MTILVLIEHLDGTPTGASLEALALARGATLAEGAPLAAALLGPGAARTAEALGAWGVARAWIVEDEALEPYAPGAWGRSLAGVAVRSGARLILGAGTTRGQELLAAAAAHLGAPLAAGCVAIGAADPESAPSDASAPAPGSYAITRLRWGGSVLEEAILAGNPAFAWVPEHALAAADPVPGGAATPTIERLAARDLGVTREDLRVRLVQHEPARPGSVALADARVVIGGGRGVGGPEGFAQLEELAVLLGGTIGVSRVVTSAGWRPHSEQVGQTGTRIAPELYIACGISGAIQHIVGCRSARAILAINTDPDAPIMSRATHAVIGDLHEVVPAITAELRRSGVG